MSRYYDQWDDLDERDVNFREEEDYDRDDEFAQEEEEEEECEECSYA